MPLALDMNLKSPGGQGVALIVCRSMSIEFLLGRHLLGGRKEATQRPFTFANFEFMLEFVCVIRMDIVFST